MKQFICARLVDGYLIASRFNNVGAKINEKMFRELLRLSDEDSKMPQWAIKILEKLGFKANCNERLSDVILVKKPTNFNFGIASYEITEECNYICRHCYLCEKSKSILSLEEKKNIIKLIEKSGCLWLQITGGEPCLDKDFVEVYSLAYNLGFLITLSTNGSFLSTQRIADTLKSFPPYRLTISIYGATAYSYEALTQNKGSFQKFMDGLSWARSMNIRTRLNVIATICNQNEIGDMVSIAKEFGFEYHVFPKLSPTLNLDLSPTKLMIEDCESVRKYNASVPKNECYTPCEAGKKSFHINSSGKMSICKIAREPNIDVLKNDVNCFSEIFEISEKLLSSLSLCNSCELRKNCTTCPLVLKMYDKSAEVPYYVCKKYYLKGGE